MSAIDALRDDRVLQLRERGRSFAGIAKELGYERTVDANDAFNRAVRERPEPERSTLRGREERRLDLLAERTRRRPDLRPRDVERRLAGIEALRVRLMAE